MRKLLNAAVAILTAASVVACSSTTLIRSTDSEAKIYVDGEYKGKGTAIHSDTKIVGASTSVRVEKEGCEPQIYSFQRSEQFEVGPCIGGVLVLFPFLWVMGYKPERTYEYNCVKRK